MRVSFAPAFLKQMGSASGHKDQDTVLAQWRIPAVCPRGNSRRSQEIPVAGLVAAGPLPRFSDSHSRRRLLTPAWCSPDEGAARPGTAQGPLRGGRPPGRRSRGCCARGLCPESRGRSPPTAGLRTHSRSDARRSRRRRPPGGPRRRPEREEESCRATRRRPGPGTGPSTRDRAGGRWRDRGAARASSSGRAGGRTTGPRSRAPDGGEGTKTPAPTARRESPPKRPAPGSTRPAREDRGRC